MPPEVRAARREEVDGAPERAVEAAKACDADELVVPGELWDAENVAAATIHRLLEAFASFERPVFVAPGNHDFAGAGGWYDPSVLSALGMRAWPENVVVFRSSAWETVPFPGRDDVTVTGRGLDEKGARVFLKVSLVAGSPARVETLPADARVVHDLAVDATDLEGPALAERIETAWAVASVGAGDLVRLTLSGTQPYGARPADTARAFAPRVRHLVVRDLTAPPSEDGGLRSAEGRFAADLKARRDAAAEDGPRRVAELALRLGRDALAGRPVLPPEPEDA